MPPLPFLRYPLMAPAEDGGGAGGGAGNELVEVELQGGVKVKMGKAEAEVYKTARTKDKTERDEMATKLGAEKAERDNATKKAEKAEQDRQAAEAMKAGEIDKAKELLTRESKEQMDKVRRSLAKQGLKAAVMSTPGIIASAVDDVVAQLENRVTFDIDANVLVHFDAAGQPAKDKDSGKFLGADALLKDFLATRPHFMKDGTPPGTGASGPGKGKAQGSITVAEYNAALKDREKGQAVAKAIAAGEMRVVD